MDLDSLVWTTAYCLMLAYLVPCYFMSIATAETPFPRCFYLHNTIFTYFTLLYAWTIKSCILGLQESYVFITLQKWFSKWIPHCQIFPAHTYLLTIPEQDLCTSTPASISFPLCLLAKVYFIIFLYFITFPNISIIISIVSFTSAPTFCIRYLTPVFAYHCILWETLQKPHADT